MILKGHFLLLCCVFGIKCLAYCTTVCYIVYFWKRPRVYTFSCPCDRVFSEIFFYLCVRCSYVAMHKLSHWFSFLSLTEVIRLPFPISNQVWLYPEPKWTTVLLWTWEDHLWIYYIWMYFLFYFLVLFSCIVNDIFLTYNVCLIRMPIIDKFKDMGTVVMGKIESGSIREGDNLLVMPNKVFFLALYLVSFIDFYNVDGNSLGTKENLLTHLSKTTGSGESCCHLLWWR